MGKAEILTELCEARAAMRAALDGLSEEDMLRPGVVGIWSVKDTLAHLAAWEAELVTALNQAQIGHEPAMMAVEDIDEWNEDQYHVNASRPLKAILGDWESVLKMLIHMVEDYNERDLIDGRRYPWMEGEPLTYLIEETASLHEREHAEDIRAWRERDGL
jgi:hypothetical protein